MVGMQTGPIIHTLYYVCIHLTKKKNLLHFEITTYYSYYRINVDPLCEQNLLNDLTLTTRSKVKSAVQMRLRAFYNIYHHQQ